MAVNGLPLPTNTNELTAIVSFQLGGTVWYSKQIGPFIDHPFQSLVIP